MARKLYRQLENHQALHNSLISCKFKFFLGFPISKQIADKSDGEMLVHNDDLLGNLTKSAVPFPAQSALWSDLVSHPSPKLMATDLFLPLTKPYSVHFCRQQNLDICNRTVDVHHAEFHHIALCLCFANAVFYLLLGVVEVFVIRQNSVWAQVPTHSLSISPFWYLAVELVQDMLGNSPCHRLLWQQEDFLKDYYGHCNWQLTFFFFSAEGECHNALFKLGSYSEIFTVIDWGSCSYIHILLCDKDSCTLENLFLKEPITAIQY